MNIRDPDSMNGIIGNVLRYGVLLSAAVVLFGTFLLASSSGTSETSGILTYHPDQVPHGNYDVSFHGLISGLMNFNAYSWIELGVIFLIATPVSRVLISIFLFAAERDRLYVIIASVVLTLLLFSMLVTPFIPFFHA